MPDNLNSDVELSDAANDSQHLFKDLVHVDPANAKKKVILRALCDISEDIVIWRSNLARQLANPTAGQSLMQAESQIGAKVFGAVRRDQVRSFFCNDSKTWLFFEADRISNKIVNERSIRYEITSDNVIKSIKNHPPEPLNELEMDNFYNALKAYSLLVKREIYSQ